jgi:kinesin family protein 2/24
VKKRPIFAGELANGKFQVQQFTQILGEIDCVSASNPMMIVHECKYKVDGITKMIDNSEFQFDNAFSHEESNEDLYDYSVGPILDLAFN